MNTDAKIPFLDLVTPHHELEEDLVAVFRQALKTAGFIGGPMVQGFEEDFAGFCGTRHCVGVGSGTDALRFALLAAGVGGGDTVLTVPNTFIATTEAVSQAGAVFDFVDVDESTYNMSPEQLREYLETKCDTDPRTGIPVSRRTGSPVKAVVPVHLYGQTADMDAIFDVADRFRLIVVEDACQAHGAEYFSRKRNAWCRAGSMGAAAAFSFYPGKNLGACGEAGAVTTDDDGIAAKIRMIRDHGQARKYHHDVEGYNGRLDAIQAGILRVKLRSVDRGNGMRREIAARYNRLLSASNGLIAPMEPSWSRAVYHLYVVRTRFRDDVLKYLSENGIVCGLHYPVPLHLQKAYSGIGYREGDFPVSEKVAKEILSLPMYPTLQVEQQARVIDKIKTFFSDH